MKNSFLLFFMTISATVVTAQQDFLIRDEIDREIWYPFITSYNSHDAEAFNAIHADDMLRASPWGLREGPDYKKRNLEKFPMAKERGDVRNISFTFEYRVHEAARAYEVGYYRIVSKQDGEEKTFYGQFHVVLRKEADRWLIIQDWDADKINGEPVGEVHFMKYADKGLYEIKE